LETGEDVGTLPPDVRTPERAPEADRSRAAALKLAQEVGKAFAHVTLAVGAEGRRLAASSHSVRQPRGEPSNRRSKPARRPALLRERSARAAPVLYLITGPPPAGLESDRTDLEN
jgi:hypothetical protein